MAAERPVAFFTSWYHQHQEVSSGDHLAWKQGLCQIEIPSGHQTLEKLLIYAQSTSPEFHSS